MKTKPVPEPPSWESLVSAIELTKQAADAAKAEVERLRAALQPLQAEADRAAHQLASALALATSRYTGADQRFAAHLANHQQWLDHFAGQQRQLRETYDQHKALGARRAAALRTPNDERRAEQLATYLDGFYIVQATIDGITPNLKSALISYGIETAADITNSAVDAVPGFGPVRTQRMQDWRAGCERGFVFNRALGVDPAKQRAIESRFLAERHRLEQALSTGHTEMVQQARDLFQRAATAKRAADAALHALAQAKADAAAV